MGMSPEQWDRVKDLYEAALECDPTQRADFLQRNTTDEVVRKEALRLLAEHDNVGSFLSTPPFVDYELPAEQPEKRFVPGELLAERFRIVGFIAAGGMGEVYEAEDLALKENLAIKTIRPEVLLQNNALARFKREVQLARRVTHPNICRVFDLIWHKRTEGEVENVIVFVSMELLQGETLSERIRRAGRFSAEEALPLINQIASGLEAAHRAGVVHRDLKPGNVILVPDTEGNQIRCVITDFGLALRSGVDGNKGLDLSATHGVFGTPAYMAPEQIEGKEVTKLADIYALGLIIYEMVTGEHAFPADTPLASAAKRLSDPIVSPKRFAPELSDTWEQTIIRCLQREPNARYSSALNVTRALSGETQNPSPAIPVPANLHSSDTARIPPPWWRRKYALGIAGLILASLILGTNYYTRRKHFDTPVHVTQVVHKAITSVGNAVMPAISPDGKFVAYVLGQYDDKERLMLQNLSGGPSLELLQAAGVANPLWSPDGSELLVSMKGSTKALSGLAVISSLGGAPRPLGLHFDGYCWSQDGVHVLASATNFDAGIRWINKQTGEEKEILAPRYQWLIGADCSAQTGDIVLLTRTADQSSIWTMKADGSQQRRLIEEKKEFTSPRWSSRGDAIYYFRKEEDTMDLVKLSLSGKVPQSTDVISGLEAGDDFTISADGTQLAYTRIRSLQNLWRAELPANGAKTGIVEKPLTSGLLVNDFPSVSPDGRWLLFTSGRKTTTTNVYKMPIAGGDPIQLTFFDSAFTASPSWSPDGRRIAFICNQGGIPKVWLMSADGGTPKQFEKTNAADTNHGLSWFPNSEIVYQQPGLHNLRGLNPDTQQEEPLLPVDSEGWLVSRPKFSPDGKTFALLWNRPPTQGLWIANLQTHSEQAVSPNPYWALGWSPDGTFLYAGKWGGRDIVRIDVRNSKETKTNIPVHGLLNAGAVSPDGRKVIVGAEEDKSDVWLMKNFDPQADRERQSAH